jgi:tetratricopeptide (TPR) repeat protein
LEEALKNRGAEEVFPDGLPPLDEQATRAMLVEHLGRLKYALFERDEGERNRFVEAVTRKSEGLPLYVRMVIEDLKAGQLTVRDEGKLPDGWDNYCERLLERWSSVGTVLPPLMCLLAWAKEPITEGTMNFLLQPHHHAGTPRWGELFRKALKYGHLMLQRRPTPDDESGWKIYHDSFRQHLLKKSERVCEDREWAQERWLKVCEDWKALASQEPSLHRYILRHYAEHLYDKWQMTNEQMTYDALCRLALDSDFKQAQTKHLPKEPNLPLKTVQLALDAAIQLEDAPMMARLLIEHAKRAQSEETPLQAWRKGHRDRALELATDIVFKRDHKLGTLWSLLLAWVAETEGERDWAKRFLDEVRKRWEGAKLTELDGWQGEMAAFLLGELGQVEGAIGVAGLVLDDKSKEELATSWASKELFDQALKGAEGIEEAWWRAWALVGIAKEMAKAGILEQAKEVFDQALKVAEGIKDAWDRAMALREIAEGMAKAGMEERTKEIFEQALEAAEEIEDARGWAEALGKIAKGMVRVGMEKRVREVFEHALKIAEEIEEAWWREEVLEAIIKEMTKARAKEWAKEIFEYVLEVVEKFESDWRKAEVLEAIAINMAKADMFEKVLKVAKEIKEIKARIWALSAIAIGMAIERIFDQALQVTEKIEDAIKREQALSAIAGEMAKARMFDQALRVAEGIRESNERAKALGMIAEEMAKVGMFNQALKIAEGIEDGWERAWALVAIAGEMAKAGMFDQALKLAEGIEDAEQRAKALREIARETAKVGMVERAKEVFEQALKAAEGIKHAKLRTDELDATMQEMVRVKMFEQVLKVTERVEKAWEKRGADDELIGLLMLSEVERKIDDVWTKEIEEIWYQSLLQKNFNLSASDAITEWVARVGIKQALEAVREIKDVFLQSWLLKEIAKEIVKSGMFDQALKVAKGIKDAMCRLETLMAIAREMAKAGEVDGVIGIVKRETGSQMKMLSSVLEPLAERARKGDEKSKEGFLELLPLCGWSLELAYKACELLHQLYPERKEEISRVVSGE